MDLIKIKAATQPVWSSCATLCRGKIGEAQQ